MQFYVSNNGVNIIGRDGQQTLNIQVNPQQFSTVAVTAGSTLNLKDILQVHSELFKTELDVVL